MSTKPRIPQLTQSLARAFSGYEHAVTCRNGTLRMRYAQCGEKLVEFCRGGRGDYYVWDTHAQQRVVSFKRARDMWRFANRILLLGPAAYGLCHNPWSVRQDMLAEAVYAFDRHLAPIYE